MCCIVYDLYHVDDVVRIWVSAGIDGDGANGPYEAKERKVQRYRFCCSRKSMAKSRSGSAVSSGWGHFASFEEV